MMRKMVGSICAVLVMALSAAAAAAPVAVVSDLAGKAAMVTGATRTPVVLLADVEPNAQIELDGSARLVVLYLDGSGEYSMTGPALVSFGAQQPKALKGAQPQKRTVLGGKAGKEVRLKPVGAVQGALVMRSSAPNSRIRIVNPAGTRTLEPSPQFRWQFEAANATYHFELVDEGGNVVHEAQVAGTTLKLPATLKLKENAAYTWTVSTRVADGRKYSTTSDFSIAPASLRSQVAAAQPQPNSPVSDRVAYALWLEQLELKDAARKLWQTIAAERPQEQRLEALARE